MPPLTRTVLPLLLLAAVTLAARGAGCVIDRVGRYVPEREQQAFIDWHDGQQCLHVATRTDPAGGPTLWIVPIRADPTQVKAEPVEDHPWVSYYQPLADRARKTLDDAIETTWMLDSGLF